MKTMIAGFVLIGSAEVIYNHACRLYWQKDIPGTVDKVWKKLYNIITD